jgi:orotate phosphoribosyltransferase-like protein
MRALRRLKEYGLSVRKIASEMSISPTTVQKLVKLAA